MSLNTPEMWRTSARRSRMEFGVDYLERHHPVWFEQIQLAEKRKEEELKKQQEKEAQEQSSLVFPAIALLSTQNAPL